MKIINIINGLLLIILIILPIISVLEFVTDNVADAIYFMVVAIWIGISIGRLEGKGE
jgi:MFS-type transporter involved in bile tolerance (Atg22 family)